MDDQLAHPEPPLAAIHTPVTFSSSTHITWPRTVMDALAAGIDFSLFGRIVRL
jgi:hypothetical protein